MAGLLLYSIGMKDIVRLGPRLQAAANMICRAGTVLDVGCDHGKLAAALLAQGRAARVIAMDISAPSLEKARLLAARHGLEGRMETRLSDGLRAAAPGEAEAIVLAGMGGELMMSILSACPDTVRAARLIVLQPMSGIEELRRYIAGSCLGITDEVLALETGRIYQILALRPGCAPARPDWFPAEEELIGHIPFETGDPLLPRYLEGRRLRLRRRLEEAERSGVRPEALVKVAALTDRLTTLAMERMKP